MRLSRIRSYRTLGNKGITHLLVPLLIVTAIGVAGAFTLVASHADTVCGRGQVRVEALPTDFVSGTLKAKALKGKGLMCVKKGTQGTRPIVTGPRENSTIVKTYNCGNNVVAYDGNNPSGTGFHKHWFAQTFNGSSNNGKKTLYCIPRSMLNENYSAAGKKVGAGKVGNNITASLSGDGHRYRFVPQYTAGEQCSASSTSVRYRHTACTSNRYFTTYHDAGGDYANPKK